MSAELRFRRGHGLVYNACAGQARGARIGIHRDPRAFSANDALLHALQFRAHPPPNVPRDPRDGGVRHGQTLVF